MSYVHELCLVKWLLAKNIRHCELCKQPFLIQEEIGSPIEIVKDLAEQTMKSKKRVISAAIYGVYIYFLGKRFYASTRYFAGVLLRWTIRLAKSYARLFVAEFKFLTTLLLLPFVADKQGRMQRLRDAANKFLSAISSTLSPQWFRTIRSDASMFVKLMHIYRALKSFLLYVYNVVVLKQLLVIIITEFLRVKRLILKTISTSRRLRVKDTVDQE